MDDVAELKAIEAIKSLKAKYCRLLDTKQWDGWRAIFTDDFFSDTTGSRGGKKIKRADEFVAFVRSVLDDPKKITCHQVHAPEIELTSETTANGIWALEDLLRVGWGFNFQGRGHYHETYEKINGVWLIQSSALTRLREDLSNGLFSIFFS